MGALTHSKLDRAVVARYFAFLVASQLIIFTLIGVIFSQLSDIFIALVLRTNCLLYLLDSVQQVIILIGKKASFQEIISNLHRSCFNYLFGVVH